MIRIAIVAAACAAFWLGHGRGAASVVPPAGKTPFAEVSRALSAARPIDPSVGIALVEARRLAASPAGDEVRATRRETEPQREARHRYVAAEAERLKPDLPADKLANLIAVSDRSDAQFRDARAKFMLGELSEDDYIAELKEVVRAGFDQTKEFLSTDELAALEGNADYDPFDRDAQPVEGQAPYLSRDEEKAMELDRGRDSDDKKE